MILYKFNTMTYAVYIQPNHAREDYEDQVKVIHRYLRQNRARMGYSDGPLDAIQPSKYFAATLNMHWPSPPDHNVG